MKESRHKRAGAPLLYLYGPHPISEGGGVRYELVIASAEIDPGTYLIYDVETGEEELVELPRRLTNLPRDSVVRNVTLEGRSAV